MATVIAVATFAQIKRKHKIILTVLCGLNYCPTAISHSTNCIHCIAFRGFHMSARIATFARVPSFHALLRVAMAALLLVSSAATTRAQTTSATIVGTLTDSSGARIVGGSMPVKELGT